MSTEYAPHNINNYIVIVQQTRKHKGCNSHIINKDIQITFHHLINRHIYTLHVTVFMLHKYIHIYWNCTKMTIVIHLMNKLSYLAFRMIKIILAGTST